MPTPTWATDDQVRRNIEAALPAAIREALETGLVMARVPRSRWLRVHAVRQVFAGFAVAALVDAEQGAGASEDAAIQTAARTLGIPRDTARGWLLRWRASAWGR